MSATKTVMTVSSLTMALLFGGGVFLFMNMGAVAKHVTERIASDTLGVRVQITQMDLSLQDKTVSVSGLRIANPPGFKKTHAMTVGNISIALNSISKELIHFKNIAVTDTDVNLEVREGTTNLNTIKKQMKSKPQETQEGAQEQIKVIIDRMAITQAQLNPSVVLFSEQDLTSVAVSDIILTGIGRKENGILAREAIVQVWNGISRAVNKSANSAGFYQGMSPDAVKDMGLSQVQQFKDQLKKDVETLGDGIKGLFGE